MHRLIVLSVLTVLLTSWTVEFSKAFGISENHAAEVETFLNTHSLNTRPTKRADRIGINILNEVRLIIPNKCETEGVAELHQLTLRAHVEESYVFIPKLCLWVEVGHDETPSSVQLDLKFVKFLLKQYVSLVFFHIQPGVGQDIGNYFPSYSDFLTLILINASTVGKEHIKIDHRIITRLGVIQYGFANKGQVKLLMEKYRASGLKGYETQNLAYEYLRPKYKKKYYEKIQDCQRRIGSNLKQLSKCWPFLTDAFLLTFRPIVAEANYLDTSK